MLGPIDHTRLPQLNRLSSSPLRYPPEAVRLMTGKKAALATPIRALVEASSRSDALTSGRRSNNSDGRPAGISGGTGFQLLGVITGSRNTAGLLPARIASAFSNSVRRCA